MKTTSVRGVFVRGCACVTLIGILAVPVFAAAADEPSSLTVTGSLLDRVIDSASRMYNDLTNFVCREDIERYRGNSRNPAGRKLDLITSTVSYDRDAEHYTDIYQNSKRLNRIRGLSGAWSEGEYGTLLGETLRALQSGKIGSISSSTLGGVSAVVYSFDYSADDSPWDIDVGGRHYLLAFRGQVWVAPATGQVLRVDRIATDVPERTGIAAVNWSVSFGAQMADKRAFWLPNKAVYSVSYREEGRHEWNLIAFSEYRRYGSDVVVRFE